MEVDVGNLMVYEAASLNKKTSEEELLDAAKRNVQRLFDEIFVLPHSLVDSSIMAQLPEPTTILPRSKPIPSKAVTETRWEKFAKVKGIRKQKRSRMEYDETTGEYKPIYGYKSTKNDSLQDWCIEVPQNAG